MKPTRSYSRHGLNALKARVKVRGLGSIDRRSAAYRAMDAWRSALVVDLGGKAALSAQQLALVDVAARTRVFLDHVDAYLLEQPSLVNRRHRVLVSVLSERQQLADHLARVLGQLGLERRVPTDRPQTLPEILAARAAAAASPHGVVPAAIPAAGEQEDGR